jgi:hypothetical protein
MSFSKIPKVFGLVSIIPATSSDRAAFNCSKSTVPSGVDLISIISNPQMVALAGLVPWAESGTITFVRLKSPL